MRRADGLAVLLLLCATGALYWPYAGDAFISGNADRDAVAYLCVLRDACEQARAGVWPVYVGQSEARFNGGLYPQAQAPLFTFVAPLVDLLTARALAPTALMNLMLMTAALGGALSTFAALRRLAPDAPWVAAALAFAYVACPGVMGVLVRLDMVTSFLCVALLPWLWRALFDVWEGAETRGGVGLGLTLAALVALHPPVALWAGTAAACAGLAGLALLRRGPRAALVGAGVFGLAAAWPLTSAFGLAQGRAHAIGVGGAGGWLAPEMVQGVMASVRADFPAALLPLGWARGGAVNGWPGDELGPGWLPALWRGGLLPYLQLGYGLWSALLGGGALALLALARRRPFDPRLVALLAAAALLVVCLWPVPVVTERLWSALPGVYTLTKWWPAQRLYLVLASLAAPVGLLAWNAARPAARPRHARVRPALVLLLCAWSAAEASKLTRMAATRRVGPEVARIENLPLRAKDLQMSAQRKLPEYGDAAASLSVRDERGMLVRDNQAALRAACQGASGLPRDAHDALLGHLRLTPARRVLLCLRDTPAGARVEAYGDGFYRHLRTGIWSPSSGLDVLPLFTSGARPLDVHVRLLERAGRRLPLDGLTVAPYARERLPLRVTSWVPLRVDLSGAGLASDASGLLLNTGRQFVAGYEARVDGQPVAVQASPEEHVLVPLRAGAREVTLSYVGTPGLRLACGVSLATWLAAALAGLRARRTRALPV